VAKKQKTTGSDVNTNNTQEGATMTRDEIVKQAQEMGLSVKERVVLEFKTTIVKYKEVEARVSFFPGIMLQRVLSDRMKGENNLTGIVLGVEPTQSVANAFPFSVVVEIPSPFGTVRLYGKVGNKIYDGDMGSVRLDLQSYPALVSSEAFKKAVGAAFLDTYGTLQGKEIVLKKFEKAIAEIKVAAWNKKYDFSGKVFFAIGTNGVAKVKAHAGNQQAKPAQEERWIPEQGEEAEAFGAEAMYDNQD
jgi:hypothetical protein